MQICACVKTKGGLRRRDHFEQCRDAEDADHPTNVVSQDTEADFYSDFLYTSKQEVSLTPAVLDRAEGMLTETLSLFGFTWVLSHSCS